MRNFINIIEGQVIHVDFSGKPVDKIAKIRGGADIYAHVSLPKWDSLDDFSQGYIHAALVLSDEASDSNYNDFNVISLRHALHDCINFQYDNAPDLHEYFDHSLGSQEAGHDFWMTRSRFGAGFGDRGLPSDLSYRLTTNAQKYPEVHLVLGDDKALYFE
jgi:hypothetical protein